MKRAIHAKGGSIVVDRPWPRLIDPGARCNRWRTWGKVQTVWQCVPACGQAPRAGPKGASDCSIRFPPPVHLERHACALWRLATLADHRWAIFGRRL